MWGCWSRGGGADLPQEALGAERGGELRVQDLQRDRPVVLEVVGEVDRGHPPAPELALDRVAVGQSGLERPTIPVRWPVLTRSYAPRLYRDLHRARDF